MKFNQLNSFLVFIVLVVAITGCKQKSGESFELKGKLLGIKDGKIYFSKTKGENTAADTALIKNGEFVLTGDIPMPAQYMLQIEGKEYPCYFYAENVKMTLSGHADSIYKAVVTGGQLNEEEKRFQDSTKKMIDKYKVKYKLDTLIKVYKDTKSEALKKQLDDIFDVMAKDLDASRLGYIKKNPSSYYSAILVDQMSGGQSAAEIEANLKLLDPKLNDFSVVEDIRTTIENMKTTDVKVDAFTSNAPDINYAVEKSFSGLTHKDIVYLAALPNDNILGLRKDGFVSIIDPNGKELGKFKTSLKSTPSALAVDHANSNIYVLGTINETKERKSRGKTIKYDEPKGAECLVYDAKGTEVKKISISELKSVTGAKVINNKLLIADFNSRSIFIYDLTAGKIESKIKDLRACCKILDFGSNSKNEIIVANLGAFRVQAYDYTGKIKYAFGKRGQAMNDFHGCCNPVNVATLTSGAIVTVEKDPTRIKIYSKSGAKQIEGIQELVKGCKYIPMTSDSKNNIYLASAQSGIVKCSAGKSK